MSAVPASEVIELKELRIGNILSFDSKFVHVTSISLDVDDEYEDTIGFCELGKSSNEMGGWNRNLADKLKRLRLTHEILEKSGFVKKTYLDKVEGSDALFTRNIFSIEVYDSDLELKSASNNFENVINEKESPMEFYPAYLVDSKQRNIYLRPVEFLHDLQNLYFALSGQELKVPF